MFVVWCYSTSMQPFSFQPIPLHTQYYHLGNCCQITSVAQSSAKCWAKAQKKKCLDKNIWQGNLSKWWLIAVYSISDKQEWPRWARVGQTSVCDGCVHSISPIASAMARLMASRCIRYEEIWPPFTNFTEHPVHDKCPTDSAMGYVHAFLYTCQSLLTYMHTHAYVMKTVCNIIPPKCLGVLLLAQKLDQKVIAMPVYFMQWLSWPRLEL